MDRNWINSTVAGRVHSNSIIEYSSLLRFWTSIYLTSFAASVSSRLYSQILAGYAPDRCYFFNCTLVTFDIYFPRIWRAWLFITHHTYSLYPFLISVIVYAKT